MGISSLSTITYPAEQRVVVDNVRWSTYVALLEDTHSRRGRITYDHGVLEIMSPSKLHEKVGRLLGRMVEAFTEELQIEIESTASTTIKHEAVKRGFEADESYYIQNADAVRGKDDIDPAVDPPPDLVIEIDGGYHEMVEDDDRQRQAFLEREGYQVVRFSLPPSIVQIS